MVAVTQRFESRPIKSRVGAFPDVFGMTNGRFKRTRNFTSGKSDVYILAAAATCGFKMVLRPTAAALRGFTMILFTEPVSCRNTFVGGTCALHRVPF